MEDPRSMLRGLLNKNMKIQLSDGRVEGRSVAFALDAAVALAIRLAVDIDAALGLARAAVHLDRRAPFGRVEVVEMPLKGLPVGRRRHLHIRWLHGKGLAMRDGRHCSVWPRGLERGWRGAQRGQS